MVVGLILCVRVLDKVGCSYIVLESVSDGNLVWC